VLLAVLLLHLAAGSLLLRQSVPRPTVPAGSTALRLIADRRPPPVPAPRPAARAATPLPRTSAGPNAITLPEVPAIAVASPTAVVAPAAPAASTPAPLDLRLPVRVGAPPPPSLADQMRADPRANSPRASPDEQLAAAMGAGETVVIDGVQGGRMIRGPNGACSLVRPTMMQQVDPSDERWRQLPAKVSDCSQLQPGARRHKRPP